MSNSDLANIGGKNTVFLRTPSNYTGTIFIEWAQGRFKATALRFQNE
jgi:hypothetical protein